MRVAIADHFGWAVAVTASADHEVVDRRRIELIGPGVSAAPIHYESRRLDVAETAALVAKARASVARVSSAALDDLAATLSAPVRSISLRTWVSGPPPMSYRHLGHVWDRPGTRIIGSRSPRRSSPVEPVADPRERRPRETVTYPTTLMGAL
jgi:hypothetical protein